MVIAQQAQVKEVGSGGRDRTLERCGTGEPCAQWHPAVQHQVDTTDLVTGFLQGPENPGGVAAPTRRVAGPDVIEVELVLLAGLHRAQSQAAVRAQPHRGIRSVWECYRKAQAGVVVSVFADEVNPSGRGPDAERL